jgi:uncharacterized protein (UPF0262 family)
MPLTSIVIDEQTFERGSEAQHAEWDANIRELLAKARGNVEPDATLHVSMTEQGFVLELQGENGAGLGTIAIPHSLLADHIIEYVDIVRQIDRVDGVNQMEALDMAKKVTHDRAGRLLKRELRQLGLDLEAARRLFTLLLSLRVDTTRLTGIHGHRTIR